MKNIILFLSTIGAICNTFWLNNTYCDDSKKIAPLKIIGDMGDGQSDWGGYTNWEYQRFSPDGKYLAASAVVSAGKSKAILIFNTQNWEPILKDPITSPLASDDVFTEIEFSPESDQIAITGDALHESNLITEGTSIVDAKTAEKKVLIKQEIKDSYSIPVWSPVGGHLVIAQFTQETCTAYIYKFITQDVKDKKTGKAQSKKVAIEEGKIENITCNGAVFSPFSPSGDKAYFTQADGTWVIWDIKSGNTSTKKMDINGDLSFLGGKIIVFNREKGLVNIYSESETKKLYSLPVDKTAWVSVSADEKDNPYLLIRNVKTEGTSNKLNLEVFDLQNDSKKSVKQFEVTAEPDGTMISSRVINHSSLYAIAQEKRSVIEVWDYLQGTKKAELDCGNAQTSKIIYIQTQTENQLGLLAATVKKKTGHYSAGLANIFIWNLKELK